jgi:predicted nucleotidyltransferase
VDLQELVEVLAPPGQVVLVGLRVLVEQMGRAEVQERAEVQDLQEHLDRMVYQLGKYIILTRAKIQMFLDIKF